MNKEITCTVNYGRGKTKDFTIYIVPNRFNVDFMEYCKNEAKVSEAQKTYEPGKDEKSLKEWLEEILDSKYDLISTILYANEYIEDKKDFDRAFWYDKANPADVDKFLMDCFAKDKDMNELKKKLQSLKVN